MHESKENILFIEDDKVDRMAFQRFVAKENFPYEYVMADSVREAKNKLAAVQFSAVVTDYLLGDGTAFDLFEKAGDTPIIIITGAGDQEIAVRAMKSGAYDYLIKDHEGNYLETLAITVENAINRKRTEKELRNYQEHLEELVEERTAALQKEIEERKRIEEKIISISEKERQKLGHDLHDDLGQYLTGIKYMVTSLIQKMKDKAYPEVEAMKDISRHIGNTIERARMLARGMCPVMIGEEGFIGALEELCTEVENIYNITCRLVITGHIVLKDTSKSIHLFHIAQESINNALKHGNPGYISIVVSENNSLLHMKIENDFGKREMKSKRERGIGIDIMRYRANIIGSELNIIEKKDKFIVELSVIIHE